MNSIQELQEYRNKVRAQMGLGEDAPKKTRIVVGMATCGIAAGARPILDAITEELRKAGLQDVTVKQTGCIGICQYEPVVEVFEPDGRRTTYVMMTAEKAVRIVTEHIVGGVPVSEYTIGAHAQ